ncbi:MAG TPA: ATP-binding protein [Pyrinomonadaceae bacterium]|jgi:signal transduction histidine kinase/ActR/RegA family two-component response regulator
MMRKLWAAAWRYGLASGAFVLLLLTSFAAQRLFGVKFDPTSLIIILMIASAWYLGRGPGLLIAVAFELMLDYFAGASLTTRTAVVLVNRMVLFGGVVWFANSRRRAERERDELLRRERAARAEAETASRLKDEFLATVSHELRTPLNAILGWAVTLNRGRADDEMTRNALVVIERNARAQAKIIDDILDVSRIIAGKYRISPRPVALAPLVQAAVGTLHPAAAAKSITLDLMLDPAGGEVVGDPDRLQQIVWNLVSNAIKFTPAGGLVEVRLGRAGAQLELSVRDDGIAISPEFLPHIFERFRQADSSTTRTHGGLGLGLAIVRHLVELHGGTVEAASEGEDRGAVFTVRVPAVAAAAEAQTPSARAALSEPSHADAARAGASHAPDLRGVRVLVVDDEPDTLEVLCLVLNQSGAKARAAGSSAAALAAVLEWRPHVLVSDLGMPGEDGFALISKVRTLTPEQGGDTPAVALTAYVREEERQRALAAGYQMHVPKPVDPTTLLATVSGLAKGQREPRL